MNIKIKMCGNSISSEIEEAKDENINLVVEEVIEEEER